MEEKPLYRNIIKKSWAIAKTKKNLLFFGFLTAMLGIGGEFEILSRATSNGSDNQGIITGVLESLKMGWQMGSVQGNGFWQGLWSTITQSPLAFIGAILIAILTLAITLFFIWLAIISQTALINNIGLINKGKKTSTNGGIEKGLNKFWPVFSVNLVLKAITFILFGLWGATVILLSTSGLTGLLLYYILFVIFILVVWSLSFIARYQIFHLVLKNQSLKKSLLLGWNTFKNNWLISLEMSFFLFLVYLVSIVITAFIAGVLASVPFVVLPIVFVPPMWVAIIIGLISIILIIVISVFITAMLSVFTWSCWSLLFENIEARGQSVSKIIRTSKSIPEYIFKK